MAISQPIKKLLLLSCLLIILPLPLWSQSYNFSAVAPSGQTLYYKINSDKTTVNVVSENNSEPYYTSKPTGNLTIPSTVTKGSKTYTVTSIGVHAFRECNGLISISIPNSLTKIGNFAFYNCSALISINFPNSLKNIGDYAFEGCLSLTPVSIPNSITYLAQAVFKRTGLTKITIPSSVTSTYGTNVFVGSLNLISINIAEDNPAYKSIDGVWLTKDATRLLSYPAGKAGNYSIPNTVTIIDERAFYGYTGEFITCEAVSPPTISINTFNYAQIPILSAYSAYDIPLYVPCSSIESYRNHTIWGNFTTILPIENMAYNVSVSSNNASMGNISGAGVYNCSEIATLTATPEEGYHFVKWSDGNTDNARTVTATQDSVFTAIFAINTYTVTVAADDASKGSVTGGGTYNHGETATLTATPEEGYHFVQWSDGNTDNARTVTATQDSVFTAIFAINTYTVTVAADDASKGSVTGGGTYNHRETTTLTAIPNAGYCFFGWSDGSTENPRGVTATQDSTITAIFDFKRRNHTATVCQGEAYVYQDSVFNTTTAGTFSKEVRFSNAYDCDSVVTVTLTVTATSSASGIMLKDSCFEMGKATQLKVESPVASATYRFYDSHHALLHTGTEYTTAPLSSEEVFYVTMQEPSKCESAEKSITVSECVIPTHLFQLHKTVDNASVCKNSIVTITTVIEKLTPALIHKIQIIEDFDFANLKLLTAELKIDGKTIPYTRDIANNKLFFNLGELSGIGTYTLTITTRAFPNLGPKTETTTIRWANYPTGITETASFNVVD